MRRTEIIDTHCNICGNELSSEDMQNEYAIQECLGYGSDNDECEHRVKFCNKCFAKLLESCKLPAPVKEYIPAAITKDEDFNKYKKYDMDDPIPGEFCNLCGGTMTMLDLQDELIIQAEYNGKKQRVQLCCACFDKIIKDCKHPSLIEDWGMDDPTPGAVCNVCGKPEQKD